MAPGAWPGSNWTRPIPSQCTPNPPRFQAHFRVNWAESKQGPRVAGPNRGLFSAQLPQSVALQQHRRRALHEPLPATGCTCIARPVVVHIIRLPLTPSTGSHQSEATAPVASFPASSPAGSPQPGRGGRLSPAAAGAAALAGRPAAECPVHRHNLRQQLLPVHRLDGRLRVLLGLVLHQSVALHASQPHLHETLYTGRGAILPGDAPREGGVVGGCGRPRPTHSTIDSKP